VLVEELIGEFCACFEGEAFGEDEGVVAVEENILDLAKVR
jgi:hypothetical protein